MGEFTGILKMMIDRPTPPPPPKQKGRERDNWLLCLINGGGGGGADKFERWPSAPKKESLNKQLL